MILFITFNDSCMHKSTQTLICWLAKHLLISLSFMRKSQHIHLQLLHSFPQVTFMALGVCIVSISMQLIHGEKAHLRMIRTFTHKNVKYPCALVHWFLCMSESVDSSTGMWVVEYKVTNDGRPVASVIHLNTVIQEAHLLPVFKEGFVSKSLSFTDTLDKFQMYYVNKILDHHAFEIAF